MPLPARASATRTGLARRASVACCLAGALLGCARFGFDREPRGGDDLDAGSWPISALDGSVQWTAWDAGHPPPGGAGSAGAGGAGSGGGGGFAGSGGVASAGSGGAGSGGCAEFGPFGAPVRVAGLQQPLSIGPALSDDALTLLFVAGNPYDVFAATRPDRTSDFGDVAPFDDANSPGTEATPFLADSGLTLLLASDRYASTPGYNDLVIATRTATSDPFDTPRLLANVNSGGIELGPQLSTDGLRLYFSSDRSNNDRDIYVASRASRSDDFGTPARVAGLEGSSQEFGPTLSGDELEVFIASDRPGGAGADIWRAVRSQLGDPFEQPVNVSEVNSNGFETDPRLSADGRELFFSSSRDGNQVLWVATRACTQTR